MKYIINKSIFLTLLLATIVLINCRGQEAVTNNISKDLIEGELIYTASGPTSVPGWSFDVQFNSSNVKINEAYSSSVSRTNLVDKNSKEVLALYNEPAGKNKQERYLIYCTIEEMQKEAKSSSYGDTVKTITQEFKTIMGYRCQKTIFKLGDQVTIELWTTDKIRAGVTLPYTPLTLENVALEYDMKILGSTDRKYVIKSISDKHIPEQEFEPIVPDGYNMIVPADVFSLDTMWSNQYEENKITSFQYPSYGSGREGVKKYIADGLSKIMPKAERTGMTLDFIVSKDGSLKDILVDYGRPSKYAAAISNLLKTMPRWTPAMVKGKPVTAKVTIFI